MGPFASMGTGSDGGRPLCGSSGNRVVYTLVKFTIRRIAPGRFAMSRG